MKTHKIQSTTLAGLLLTALVGVAFLPFSTAEAHWWGWGHTHANAQEQEETQNNGDTGTENNAGNGEEHSDGDTATITIQKYIDGEVATAENADGATFPMTATWNEDHDQDAEAEMSGSFELAASNSTPYLAVSEELEAGASYSTHEVLDGGAVAATCSEDAEYKLVGYSTGSSSEAAAMGEVSTTAPAFTDLSGDVHVAVWNETCNGDEPTEPTEPTGDISGEVTGGQSDEEPAELAVTSIDAEKTTAIANGEFTDGWRYVFNITVPSDEPNLSLKFANWLNEDGEHTIPVAENMRISSEQATNASSTVTLDSADTYSSPELTMTGDLDEETDGMQVQVAVEVAVPADTFNGTYSTSYGVQTLE